MTFPLAVEGSDSWQGGVHHEEDGLGGQHL